MTHRVDCFGPKMIGGIVFIKHYPCRLNESHVLSFDHPILLWSIGSKKIMLHALLIKILFHLSVLELSSIVTPYLLDLVIILILNPLQELLKHPFS
jgi:hypothetical protein